MFFNRARLSWARSMRRAQATVIAVILGAVLHAQSRVFTPADFGTPTTVSIPLPPSGNGDMNFGFGLAIDQLPSGAWRVFTSSWNPQYVLEYALPTSLSGAATFVRNLGNLNQPGQLFGLYFDRATNRICASSGVAYDTDASTTLTLSCAEIDPTTNKFRTMVNTAGETVTVARRWLFHDASKPCRAFPAPMSTDLAGNTVTFAAPHGLLRASLVMVATTGGGLFMTSYYYVNPRTPTALSFHRTYADAYNNQSAIDLTDTITSAMTSCTPRGDRRTNGGIARVPDEFVAALKGTHVVGCICRRWQVFSRWSGDGRIS